ncbi:E3 ubiquitin-protein ligase HECW2 [Nymphon striatum]|nr:E3 ubiquitin-protein ligase HECW2 [Nymphon striatum]
MMRAQMTLQSQPQDFENLEISNAASSPNSSEQNHESIRNVSSASGRGDINLQNILDNGHHESGSFVLLSHSVYNISSNQPLKISWDIKETVSPSDWIGLYKLNTSNVLSLKEYKRIDTSGISKGHMMITVDGDCQIPEDVNKMCFRYHHGSSGVVRAISPPVTMVKARSRRFSDQNSLSNNIQIVGYSSHQNATEMIRFTITKLCAINLKKGMFFNPDPYVKLSIQPGKGQGLLLLPHHGQSTRANVALNMIHPDWPTKVIQLVYLIPNVCPFRDETVKPYPTDVLEGEVKDKFAKSRPIISRFLGKLCIPVRKLLDKSKATGGSTEFQCNLSSKNPSDNITGQLRFSFKLESGPVDPMSITSHLADNPLYVSSNVVEANSSPSTPQIQSISESSTSNNVFRQTSLPNGNDTENSANPDSPDDQPSSLPCLAFSNPEYVLQLSSQNGNDVDDDRPPLPPKSKTKHVHKALERTQAVSFESDHLVNANEYDTAESTSSNLTHVNESSNQDVVETEETSSLHESSIESPEQESTEFDSSGPSRPTSLDASELTDQLNTDIIISVPLATPEGDLDSMAERLVHQPSLEADIPESVIEEYSNICDETLESNENEPTIDETQFSSDGTNDLSRDTSNSAICANTEASPMNICDALESTEGASEEFQSPSSAPCQINTEEQLHSLTDNLSIVGESESSENQCDQCNQCNQRNLNVPPTPTHHPDPILALRNTEADRAASGNSHLNTTRLPSIPERKFEKVEASAGEEPLPPNWEARIDSHGRIFYIDHSNRTTTWQRPSSSGVVRSQLNANDLQRQQLDRRYQSIRRTISRRNHQSEDSDASGSDSGSGPAGTSSLSIQPSCGNFRCPAIKFIARPDFLAILQMNDEAHNLYSRSSSLKHMVSKIRRDQSSFGRYQHNRDLVALLNTFADTSRDLPRGWETKYDRVGKIFYIDHSSRTTTFIDPRLPVDLPYCGNKFSASNISRRTHIGSEDVRSEVGPVLPPRPQHIVSSVVPHVVSQVPTAYNDKVVAFLRQPNIIDMLRERCTAVGDSQSLKDKINSIRVDGTVALDRLSSDIDFTILLSLFEQEIMSYIPAQYSSSSNSSPQHRSPRSSPQPSPQTSPGVQRANVRAPAPYKRDFEAKLRNFYRKLESKGFGQGPGKLKLNIRRDHLLEDAFNKIKNASKKDLQKNKLFVFFHGEEGLDYGGPSREFFFLLSRELFNPYYGLFEYSANDTYTVQVSPMSAFVDNQLEWFRFSGRVLGLTLVHQYLLDAFFTRPFYKALLRLEVKCLEFDRKIVFPSPCSLSDLESLDAEFHQSLLWIKENDVTESLDMNFSVNEELFGKIVERDLKPSGRNINVTEKNKKEYIERMVKWRLERGVAEQTEALVRGFYEVVDARLVSVFDARELELVIAGTAEIDTSDWRKNTEYRSGYHDSHPVIQWFWAAIEKFDNERRLRLLQFVTGTSSVPYEGFSALRGSNGARKFCIEKWGNPTSLPRAHTCFNRLDLPPYTSSDMLYEKLLLAVEETHTFGME